MQHLAPDHVLIICLDPARFQLLAEETALGLDVDASRIQHVPAVDLRRHSKKDVLAQYGHRFSRRQMWAWHRAAQRRDDVDFDNASSLGCLLSHQKAWRMASSLSGTTLILEEDAVLKKTAAQLALMTLPAPSHFAAACRIVWADAAVADSDGWVKPELGMRFSGAWAYWVTSPGAQALLDQGVEIDMRNDAMLSIASVHIPGAVWASKPLTKQLVQQRSSHASTLAHKLSSQQYGIAMRWTSVGLGALLGVVLCMTALLYLVHTLWFAHASVSTSHHAVNVGSTGRVKS